MDEKPQHIFLVVLAHEADEAHDALKAIPRPTLERFAEIVVVLPSDPDSSAAGPGLDIHPRTTVLRVDPREGPGIRFRIGLACVEKSRGDVALVISGHGLAGSQAISPMLDALLDSPSDIIVACRPPPSVLLHPFSSILRWLTKIPLSDFSSGVRACRLGALRDLPFRHNTDREHFDIELLLQAKAAGKSIAAVKVPWHAHPGCSPFFKNLTSIHSLVSIAQYRANRLSLIYHRKFDFLKDEDRYIFKKEPTSLHQHVLKHPIAPNNLVVELGAGQGHISRFFSSRGARVVAMDQKRPCGDFPFPYSACDLEQPFADAFVREHGPCDCVIMLDVVEHMADPERLMEQVWKLLKPEGVLLLSTANIAYLPIRLMLAFGLFNYGRRGILDMTHRRLFTLKSLGRLLKDAAFRPEQWRGFGPPIADLIGRSPILRLLDRLAAAAAACWPSLFAYQILVVAQRREGLDDVLAKPR